MHVTAPSCALLSLLVHLDTCREALLAHEEALRVNRMCRELRKKDVLQEVLRYCTCRKEDVLQEILRVAHQAALTLYEQVDEEDDFQVPCTFIIRTLSISMHCLELQGSEELVWEGHLHVLAKK